MVEYIEREALLLRIDCHGTNKFGMPDEDIRAFVKAQPAADVVPVVHGTWIWHEEEFEYECSACHCTFDYNHMFEIFDHGFQYANWCPHCGAKM